jgi:hypothetical protein
VRSSELAKIAKITVIAKIEKQKLMADGMRSSTSDGLCTPKWADCKAEKQLIPVGVTGRPRDFPSVRKWDSLSLRIAVGAVQVIARREDYKDRRCRPTQ